MAMWRNTGGHLQRQLNAAGKAEPLDENLIGIDIYEKGKWRGVLARYTDCFVWDVYTDPDYQQHLDWNATENTIPSVGIQYNYFQIDQAIRDLGFTFIRSITEIE